MGAGTCVGRILDEFRDMGQGRARKLPGNVYVTHLSTLNL